MRKRNAKTPPSPPSVEELAAWAGRLVPDYAARTASGLWFVLLTWKLGGQPFYAFGYSSVKREPALEAARREAVTVRLASGL